MPYKQPSEINKFSISYASYNRIYKLFATPKFSNFVHEVRKKFGNEAKTKEDKNVIRSGIKSFLESNGYPLGLVEPIFNMVTMKELEFDFPLEDGISINVDDISLTSNTIEKRMNSLNTVEPKKFNIEISSDVSINRIVTFIEQYRELIEQIQKDLGLPKAYEDTKSKFEFALWVTVCKDYNNMSFSEIAKSEEAELNGMPDESKIKAAYYSYKDIFNPSQDN